MSELKKQLKSLERKIAKVKAYQDVISNLNAEKGESGDFPGLYDEVRKVLTDFCELQIKSIENPKKRTVLAPPPKEED